MSPYLHLVTKITAGPATTCLPILVISAEEVRDKVKIGPLSLLTNFKQSRSAVHSICNVMLCPT